jgi:hypothetical protein
MLRHAIAVHVAHALAVVRLWFATLGSAGDGAGDWATPDNDGEGATVNLVRLRHRQTRPETGVDENPVVGADTAVRGVITSSIETTTRFGGTGGSSCIRIALTLARRCCGVALRRTEVDFGNSNCVSR